MKETAILLVHQNQYQKLLVCSQDATMSLHNEIEREQVYQDLESWYEDIEPSYRDTDSSSQDIESSGSSTSPLCNDQKNVKMIAAESSPLLAAAPDAPIPPAALPMSLLRRVLLVTTMASAGLLNVRPFPFFQSMAVNVVVIQNY